MNPLPGSIPLEQPKTAVHRLPRRKVMGQLPPRTARADDIQHRIDHLAHIVPARATAPFGRRDRRADQSPLAVRHVRGVWVPFYTPLPAESGLLKHFLTWAGGLMLRATCCATATHPGQQARTRLSRRPWVPSQGCHYPN